AHIQDRVNQSAGLKIGAQVRQFSAHPFAHPVHIVITAYAMLFGQTRLHEGRVLGGVAGVDRGESRRHADVRYDHSQIVLRHLLANYLLDLLHLVLGHFQPRARRRFDVDHELTGVSSGEEGDAEQRIDQEAEREESEQPENDRARPIEGVADRVAVPVQQFAEPAIEPIVEPLAESISFLFSSERLPGVLNVVMWLMRGVTLEELCAEERDDGQRDHVGGEQREDYGQRQRREEELAHAVEEGHREEDHHGGQRGGQHRQGDLLPTLFGRHHRRFTHLQMPVDVLQYDDRVSNQAGEGEGEAAEDHGVDRTAAGPEREEGGEGRERDGEEDSHRRPHAAQKDQDHHRGQKQSYRAFVQQRLNRL